MERESAVSQIFLALILAVAIIVVAVVIVLLLFPPAPGGIPSFSANAESSGGVVYLYHDGGNDLFEGSTLFLVNGIQVPRNAVTFLHGQDWPWTEGETIRLDQQVTGPPGQVEVIYARGSDRVVVYSHEFGTLTPVITPTPSTPATGVPTSIPRTETLTPTTSIATTVPTPTPPVPLPPVALFSGIPRDGGAPLTVQFEDLSTGEPDSWSWSFGDGRGSPERDPSHVYADPGDYTISLTVSNSQGSNTRIQSSYITVKKPVVQDVYLESSTGSLLPEGSFRFVVSGPAGTIKIGGQEYKFQDGDWVELYPGDVSSGTIAVNEGGISEFSFSDVRMMVDGQEVRKGIVSGINVPDYSGLSSTMTVMVPLPDPRFILFVDEMKIMPPASGTIVLAGIGPESSGGMYVAAKSGSLSFTGSAGVSTLK
ncbi:MAG: PKD domain-containing protein [Methanoregulaceae archaeon]|nr:PKD domain-containing protein [Methanoregulaceae archaeon]